MEIRAGQLESRHQSHRHALMFWPYRQQARLDAPHKRAAATCESKHIHGRHTPISYFAAPEAALAEPYAL
jgi:hypothetical protein